MQRKVEMSAILVHPGYPEAAKVLKSSETKKEPLTEFGFLKHPYPDLAILTLSEPAPEGYAPRVEISPTQIANQGVVFAGWGDGKAEDTSARMLNKWSLPKLTDDELAIDKVSNNFIICTVGKQPASGVCGGDSGGALFDPQLKIIFGIANRAYECGTGVSYFADLYCYKHWILANK